MAAAMAPQPSRAVHLAGRVRGGGAAAPHRIHFMVKSIHEFLYYTLRYVEHSLRASHAHASTVTAAAPRLVQVSTNTGRRRCRRAKGSSLPPRQRPARRSQADRSTSTQHSQAPPAPLCPRILRWAVHCSMAIRRQSSFKAPPTALCLPPVQAVHGAQSPEQRQHCAMHLPFILPQLFLEQGLGHKLPTRLHNQPPHCGHLLDLSTDS